jgi:hypothetical protein
MGLVGSEHIEAAVHDSRVQGVLPELILVNLGQLSDEDLGRARAEHAGLDYVDLSEFDRDRDRDALIGREAAERYRALPIAVMGRSLVVAFADPINAPAIADLTAPDKVDVVAVVAGSAAISARIEELPERSAVDGIGPAIEPPRLQPVEDGGPKRPEPLTGGLADRIVERVDAAIDEVARSEILKALDDATSEIERLSAELEATEQRARALESERDELRGASGSAPGPNPS